MRMKRSYVYILTNSRRTVLYIGVTANLENRMKYHKDGAGSKFCRKYNVNILIYYEVFPDIREAIYREKILKKWHRAWKLELIRKKNPEIKEFLFKDGSFRL